MQQIIRFAAITIFILGSLSLAAPLFAQQGYVHEVSGNVTGQVGPAKPERVEKGMTISRNTTLSTGPGAYAVLKFEDGTVVLLKESTSFQVQSYSYQSKAPETAEAAFNLLRGGLRLITGLITSRNREALRVATPHVTIGIRGTDFTAELVNPLFVGVESGAVLLSNAGGGLIVSAGQFASVVSNARIATIIQAAQLPPNALVFPNVTLPPPTPLPAAPIGAGVVGTTAATGGTLGVGTTAVIVGGAIAAGIAASNGGGGGNGSTTQH